MTNQIEDAIITLIKAHAVTPEIDYTELADRLHDKVCDNVDYDAIKEQVVASLDIDAGDVASMLEAGEIASEIDLTDLASEIDLDSLANEIPMGDLATNICKQTLAEHIDLSDLAGHLDEDQLQDNIKDAVMVEMAEKFAAMEKRIAELEAKLAQPQPQPQPSTPIEMIERAKNLLADSLGMLNNPA